MSDNDANGDGEPTRAIATSSESRQQQQQQPGLNGDASSSSQINASSINQSSSAGTGSLPRQYPGRTYYFRARAPSTSAGNQAAMSLTQSHFDIREGSARLASLGLAEDFEDEEETESEERGRQLFTSQSWSNDGQDAFARRPSSAIRTLSDSPEALPLSKTPIVSGQNTPSGLSVLLQKHEGFRISPPTSGSSTSTVKLDSRASSDKSGATSTQPINGVIEEETPSAAASGSSTPVTSSEGSATVGRQTPEAGVSSASPLTSTPINMKAKKRTSVDTLKESLSADQKSLELGHSLKRKSTLETTTEQSMLGLPESYSERSPLLRIGRNGTSERGKSTSPAGRRSSHSHSGSYDTFGDGSQNHQYGASAAARWTSFFDNTKNKILRRAQSHAESAKSLSKRSASDLALSIFFEPLKTIPAVVLGILMNLLDGVSYGMIMFPVSSPVFATFGGIGVSMFFASCFVSQVIFSSRSIFKGGNGSMMIEAVPFLHVIAFSISDRLRGVENSHAVIATTMVAYALSSILTGLAFFLLGYLRLGAFIEFFPRVVLVGCIGGVGAFLVITGVQVCAGLENEHLDFSFEVIKRFFEPNLFMLWFIPLVLAAIIRVVTSSRFDHPLVFPAFFLFIPIIFYIIVFAAHIPIDTLRENGWIFQLQGVNTPWYEYFKMFDFKATDFGAVLQTMPTQLALVFFALLHVPINVPALALSVGEDNVDTNTELVNHGLSNFLSGCLGTIPNYLVYTNSVLFYRVGGTTRLSSFMLALATLAVFLIGPWVIGYLPVMIVGTLIYILGYDLLKEAVWDTYGRVSGFDYTTIWIIVAAMTYFDFVIGIGVGIVAACVSFVIVSSQRQPIRAIMSGATASSTVRRHPRQSNFLRRVGSQIRIIKLQSFLFFGTVVKVEATIRDLLDAANWEANPIRFLILDFSLASGVDFSAAEAFLRIQRLLEVREVVLVLCGCDPETPVGKSLRNIELFRDSPEERVRVFSNLNDALEHCENSQLRSLYSKTLESNITHHQQDMTRLGIDSPYRLAAQERPTDLEAFSPRRAHLLHVAKETLVGKKSSTDATSMLSSTPPTATTPAKSTKTHWPEPVRLLMQALGPYAPELKEDFFNRLVPYFRKTKVAKGQVLWQINDMADSFYVLETGILKAVYNFPNQLFDTTTPSADKTSGCDNDLVNNHAVSESMLPGTIAGEMTFLAGIKRNTSVYAERDCILWKMTTKDLKSLEEKEGPGIARSFRQCILRVSVESADVLLGHLITG